MAVYGALLKNKKTALFNDKEKDRGTVHGLNKLEDELLQQRIREIDKQAKKRLTSLRRATHDVLDYKRMKELEIEKGGMTGWLEEEDSPAAVLKLHRRRNATRLRQRQSKSAETGKGSSTQVSKCLSSSER